MENLGKVRFCLRVYRRGWFTTRREAIVDDLPSLYSDISVACSTLSRSYLPTSVSPSIHACCCSSNDYTTISPHHGRETAPSSSTCCLFFCDVRSTDHILIVCYFHPCSLKAWSDLGSIASCGPVRVLWVPFPLAYSS